jgi:hypothetical protein
LLSLSVDNAKEFALIPGSGTFAMEVSEENSTQRDEKVRETNQLPKNDSDGLVRCSPICNW